ncbi:Pycsar system effector family protein [Novosphingobium aquimarinum]|uniref:Pycsar system effector family protein n=1 Tax=Novosphingobium aquimarinum TaxID=2682494 RepID=UPI0018DCE4AF|nr:Pycsar system effector family protein [Novosphingobium aquimarinum]
MAETEFEGSRDRHPADDPVPAEFRFDDTRYSPHAVHLVRTAMTNHMALSQMADQKANILLGANFLAFTLAVGQFGGGRYSVSLLVLAVTAFFSALLAIVAVVPKTATMIDLDRPDANLLFFGTYTSLAQEEWVERIMVRSQTDGRVLSTMLRDIYQNGAVLSAKKYRYLGYAFNVFRVGLIVAFVLFLFENRTLIGAVTL